jgi:phosphotransferase system, enzyme I, PtsP
MNQPQPQKAMKKTPLQLLREVRDLMASEGTPQARLDKLVKVIAEGFESQVCSIYLSRAGDVLELYANTGLNPEAVHLTRLGAGEGLVGEVAATGEPLNLSEAREHPKFSYRPETGEDIVRSFIAVPILSAARVVGVLVVQSSEARQFTDDQLEVLQTVAMVLAELHASGKLVNLRELREGSGTGITSRHLVGMKLAPGMALGRAILHRPKLTVHNVVADDPQQELQRLEQALEDLRRSLDSIVQNAEWKEDDERAEIMESYRMFARDKGWIKQIGDAIQTGLTAEAAVQRVQEQLRARLESVSSQYIKERVQDLEDISTRLIQHLTGETQLSKGQRLPKSFVLIAKRIGPAELLEYESHRLKGLVLEEGSATSHIVIIARSMDIPVIGKIRDATRLINSGDTVILDGERAEVFVRPYEDVIRNYREQMRTRRQQREMYRGLRKVPPVTLDGKVISLNLNTGLHVEERQLAEEGVEGVGLYRTELPYMISHALPDAATQQGIYAEILKQAKNKRVIFRTFDIGGDKQLPYFPIDDEENPAMGWRATRIGIDRPTILRKQCRALLRAAAGRRLDIMFPFIANVWEFQQAKSLCKREELALKDHGEALPSEIHYGAMLEIPSLLFQLPELLPQVDFLSIGSNDLFQFLFASDRNSPHLSGRYDDISPIIIRMLRQLIEACDAAKVELGMCGDMARKPLEAMVLVGLGMKTLSAPASAIGPLKAMIRSLDTATLAPYLRELEHSTLPSVRNELSRFAKDHGVMV